MVKQISLAQLRKGQSGRIIQVMGGYGMTRRLSALGIRPGKKLTKVSAMFMRGPITVRVGGGEIALGFGMASRIIVEVEE
jgi:ferrous iron transport protein A